MGDRPSKCYTQSVSVVVMVSRMPLMMADGHNFDDGADGEESDIMVMMMGIVWWFEESWL